MLPVKIKLVNLGKVEREFRTVIGEYERRIRNLAHVKFTDSLSDDAILLDESGEEIDSDGFYNIILSHAKEGETVEFAIGPPEGFPAEIKMKHRKISLSKLTLRHEIAYLILLEQIYRALLRMKGTSYGK